MTGLLFQLSGMRGDLSGHIPKTEFQLLTSEMFLLFFFLSNSMFYLDPGLEFILHVDGFLIPCGLLLIAVASSISPYEIMTSPLSHLSRVGMQQGILHIGAFRRMLHPDLTRT